MKTFLSILTILAIFLFLSSCGINAAFLRNVNQNSTQVHLSEKNYKVVDKVSGSSDVSYVLLFIGGINKKQLYENAYASMVQSADLTSGSRALINIFTEEHVGGVPPFYIKRTITVSAHVIEFTE